MVQVVQCRQGTPAWYKCRKYARLYRLHTAHPHSSSTGRPSSLYRACLMISFPREVNRHPFRALRDGITQSIMSTPRATYSASSSGAPTPIAYRGLDAGSSAVVAAVISRLRARGSPTESPPIA
jgi:hypothetical protein